MKAIRKGSFLLSLVFFLLCCKKEIEPGVNTLVATTSEPAGANCVNGGTRIDTGADLNRNGVLDASEIASTQYVCNQGAAALPLAPSGLIAKLKSVSQVDLTWADNLTNEDGFKIDRRQGADAYVSLGSVAANVTTYSDVTVAQGNTYAYRVYSYNKAGSSLTYSNEASVTVPSPPIISSFSPTSGSIGTSVTITGVNLYQVLTATSLTVSFNGVNASVTSAGGSSVVAVVPSGSTTGKIAVTVNGVTATSTNDFTVTHYTVSTIAGGGLGFQDGQGMAAKFGTRISGITVDSKGNVFVVDATNNAVRKITQDGIVTTLAGGSQGYADGTGSAAKFNFGQAGVITIDADGNLYVTEELNNSVRKITADGVVTTFAGGSYGTADGPGTSAQFQSTRGIAIDKNGVLFVTEYGPGCGLRKITPAGNVSTLERWSGWYYTSGSIAIDGGGNIFVADTGELRIREISADGGVNTYLQKSSDCGFVIDSTGTLYGVGGNQIFKVPTSLSVSNVTQATSPGATDGTDSNAKFQLITSLFVDPTGSMFYIGDNGRIRKIVVQ